MSSSGTSPSTLDSRACSSVSSDSLTPSVGRRPYVKIAELRTDSGPGLWAMVGATRASGWAKAKEPNMVSGPRRPREAVLIRPW